MMADQKMPSYNSVKEKYQEKKRKSNEEVLGKHTKGVIVQLKSAGKQNKKQQKGCTVLQHMEGEWKPHPEGKLGSPGEKKLQCLCTEFRPSCRYR